MTFGFSNAISLFFCLGSSSKASSKDTTSKVERDSDASCVFCNVSAENGFDIVWENEKLVAFRDRSPACVQHIQLIPKQHIRSVKELRQSDVELLKLMVNAGHQLLDELNVVESMRKMGFHIPPFNSVGHLHLHVQALPYKGRAREAKYPVARGYRSFRKGFSWFVEAQQAISLLEEGRNIGVLPC